MPFLILLSLVMYIASLFLPVFEFAAHSPVKGMTLLGFGWIGFFRLITAWLSNFLYFYLILNLQWGKPSKSTLVVAIIAGANALTAFLSKDWAFNESATEPIKHYGWGFYLWIGAIILMILPVVKRVKF